MGIDSSRLTPLLRVLSLVLIACVAVNAGIASLVAAIPDLVPPRFFGIDYAARNFDRVAAVAAGDSSPASPLVVVFGLSGACQGLSVEQVRRSVPSPIRLLPQCGAGRDLLDVSTYADGLLASPLTPALALIAVSPFHFIDSASAPDNAEQRTLSTADVAGRWLVNHRSDVAHALRGSLLNLRIGVQRIGNAWASSDTEPWREPDRLTISVRRDASVLSSQLEGYARRGYFESGFYSASQRPAQALARTIKLLAARGTIVVLVLMPEHSVLQLRIPEEGVLSASAFASQLGIPVYDLRASLGDEGFADISHLDLQGRDALAPLLAEVIQNHLVPGRALHQRHGRSSPLLTRRPPE